MLKFQESNLGLNLIGCLKLHTVDAAEKLVWHEIKKKNTLYNECSQFHITQGFNP